MQTVQRWTWSIAALMTLYVACSRGQVVVFPTGSFELPLGYNQYEPPRYPTVVSLGLGVINVHGIDEINEIWSVDCYLYLHWNDDRLINATRPVIYESPVVTKVWTPDWQLFNSIGAGPGVSTLTVYPDGNLEIVTRVAAAQLSRFDYTRYPFDAQQFEMYFESFSFNAAGFLWNETDATTSRWDADILQLDRIRNSKFTFEALTFRVEMVEEGPSKGFHRAVYAWTGHRQSPFHILNHVIPLCLLTMVAFVAFFLDPVKSAPVKVGSSGVVAIMAFSISIFLVLPPVAYLTRMMIFILVSFIFIFLNFVLLIAAHKWARKAAPTKEEKEEAQDAFDQSVVANPLFDKDEEKATPKATFNTDVDKSPPGIVNWGRIRLVFTERGVELNAAEKKALRSTIFRLINYYKWIAMAVYLVCVIIIFVSP